MPILEKSMIASEVLDLLEPRVDMREDHRADLLRKAGFTAITDPARAKRLERMGSTMARVDAREDNALWYEVRGRLEDGFVRYAPMADLKLLTLVEDTLTSLASSSDEAVTTALFEKLTEALAARGPVTAERRAGLETVVRLGSAAAILAFLEADGWG